MKAMSRDQSERERVNKNTNKNKRELCSGNEDLSREGNKNKTKTIKTNKRLRRHRADVRTLLLCMSECVCVCRCQVYFGLGVLVCAAGIPFFEYAGWVDHNQSRSRQEANLRCWYRWWNFYRGRVDGRVETVCLLSAKVMKNESDKLQPI